MITSRTLAALVLAFMASATAFAQAPAPAKCDKPDPFPGRLASTEKMRGWNREMTVWQDCMKKSIAEVQARADVAVKAANAAVAEANAAIASYNDAVKEYQAQADAAK